ncbi:gliding motility-associated-like protein [Mucilaginibacter gracilis]|uniref:Gliding motility-associated-like protein n=1 Tax=Mucilaginibacter gracilis TaxID=423350 RepID=A0A495IZK8_9SPHI|nr:MBG domain-containing protein [Mucilaginibacter gracilis]RKR81454.1 gliding motility-associated-like protein [Mucilaginibacter gracilis]
MKKNLLQLVLILLFFVSAVKAQTFTSTPVTTALVGTQYNYSVFATDPSNQPLTFTAPTLPSWLTFSASGQTTPVAFGTTIPTEIGGVAGDASGNIYVASLTNSKIYKIAPDGTTSLLTSITTNVGYNYGLLVIGNYLYISYYNGNSGRITRLDLTNIAGGEELIYQSTTSGLLGMVEHNGFMYVAAYATFSILKVDLATAGFPVTTYYTNAALSRPFGLGFNAAGLLYIANYDNGTVYSWDGSTLKNIITGGGPYSDIKIDNAGYIYICSYGYGIKRYSPDFSSNTQINTTSGTWGMNITPTGALVYGAGTQAYKLQTGAVLSGTPAIANIGVHNVKITATNGTTSVDQSFTISVSGPPTITNFPDLNSNVGAAPITLTDPTSNSAGAFTYTSSNTAVATVSGNQVTIVGPGTATITATQAPNGLYITGSITATLTVANTVDPTLALGNISKTYGDAAFTLGATSNSSGAITYTSGNTAVATISGSTVTIVGQGTAVITANQAAATGFNAFSTTATLTVAKKALTIAASNATKVYGAVLPTLAVTYSGFVNGETSGVLTTQPTITTTGTASSAVGTYPITATGAVASNYTITYTAGSLTVTPAGLNITAVNQTKVYGAANPTLAVTYSGFVNGDDATKLTTQPTISTTATASSAVGTYPITATGAASANYSISYTAATLTVTQAPLVITANNISRNYGQPNPTLTVTYTGLVNGDTNASLSTQPTITTTATITSLPGTYPITASGAVGPNYSISYVAGTFRVIPLTNANLSNLTISNGILSPTFATGTFSYTTSVANSVSNVTVIPTADPTATVLVNGLPATNGGPFSVDLSVGNNTITVLVTAQDGTTKLTYTITLYRAVPPDAVFATNILTPNGDGKNDNWIIKDILLYPNNTVKVFDRAGRIVFAQHSYANTWDGTLSGSPLTEGTYYYAIDLGIFGAQPIKGYISILRKR